MATTDELLRVFAESIHAKSRALNNLELNTNERNRISESISDDIKKCSNFLVPEASEAALKKAERLNIDLYSRNWHNQSKFDPGREVFHVEHVMPVAALRERCLSCRSPEGVLEVLTSTLRVAWILKSEDRALTRLGYRSKRPFPDAAYVEAGIKLIKARKRRCFGVCKGQLQIIREDDEHLQDFKDYM
jgi:hypothetical protein